MDEEVAVDEAVEVDDAAESEEVEDSTETETAEATEDEAGDAPEESSTESEEPEKPDGVQQRMDELTRRFYEADQRAQALEQQLQQAQQQAPVEEGKSLSDFEYDEGKFAEYLTQVATQRAQADAQQAIQHQQQVERQSKFEAKASQFAAKVNDYQQVTGDLTLPVSTGMADAIVGSDKGPEVLYYLGKHREEAALLARLDPIDAAREIGRIEATKLTPPTKPAKSKPTPPASIKGSGKVEKISTTSPASDKLSDAEWAKRERARLAAKRG